MPSISYTALRSIVRVSFSAETKTTISVSSTGSPNVSTFSDSASPGSLGGLNSGEWVLVSGFTDSANNGWHQLSIDSTPTLITVTSILTTAAAGDTVSLIGYLHGLNETVATDIRLQSDDRQRSVVKNQAIALDGNVETLTHRRVDFYNVTTGVLIPADYKLMIQFLDSCESGEAFSYDRDGTLASPDNAVSAFIDTNGYTEQRLANITDRRISFRIRLA